MDALTNDGECGERKVVVVTDRGGGDATCMVGGEIELASGSESYEKGIVDAWCSVEEDCAISECAPGLREQAGSPGCMRSEWVNDWARGQGAEGRPRGPRGPRDREGEGRRRAITGPRPRLHGWLHG